ncbi:MAG: flavin reductase family protein [Deltaproteobacteria bacterium]|nr:flavin reductase family protein [Deltaproteobacteria bacterium]
MSIIQIDPAPNAYRLLNPGAVALISVGDGSADNLFSVTWNMPMRRDPGMVAILSGKRHYSYPFIQKTGEFGMNIPHAGIVDAVLGCGRTTGSTVKDKFERFGLTRRKAAKIKAPLVDEAVGSLECRVCQIVDMGASSLLIAQIVAAWADPQHYRDDDWTYDNGLRLVHHLGGDRFAVSTEEISAKLPGKE